MVVEALITATQVVPAFYQVLIYHVQFIEVRNFDFLSQSHASLGQI